MTIKQQGGIFGRNPTFNDVEVEQKLTVNSDGATALTVNRNTSDGSIIEVQKNGVTLGIFGSNSSSMYALSGDTGILFYDFADEILPIGYSANTRDGQISLGRSATRFNNLYLSGNVVVDSGSGIDFSATSGTGTSELFDDYEEGTYTATMTPETSGSITLISAVNTLTYTKTGRIVTVTGMLQVDSVASPIGSYVAVNLPFTISNIGPYASRVGSAAVSSQPGYSNRVLLGVENTSQFRMYIDASTISGGNQFSFSFNYVAA